MDNCILDPSYKSRVTKIKLPNGSHSNSQAKSICHLPAISSWELGVCFMMATSLHNHWRLTGKPINSLLGKLQMCFKKYNWEICVYVWNNKWMINDLLIGYVARTILGRTVSKPASVSDSYWAPVSILGTILLWHS